MPDSTPHIRPPEHQPRAAANDRLAPTTPGNGEVDDQARAVGERAHWNPTAAPAQVKQPEVVDETRLDLKGCGLVHVGNHLVFINRVIIVALHTHTISADLVHTKCMCTD